MQDLEQREELLFKKEDLTKMNVLRRIISPMGTMDGIEFLISKLKNTKNNAIFFISMKNKMFIQQKSIKNFFPRFPNKPFQTKMNLWKRFFFFTSSK